MIKSSAEGKPQRRSAALWELQPGALIPHNRFISQTAEPLMRLKPLPLSPAIGVRSGGTLAL